MGILISLRHYCPSILVIFSCESKEVFLSLLLFFREMMKKALHKSIANIIGNPQEYLIIIYVDLEPQDCNRKKVWSDCWGAGEPQPGMTGCSSPENGGVAGIPKAAVEAATCERSCLLHMRDTLSPPLRRVGKCQRRPKIEIWVRTW